MTKIREIARITPLTKVTAVPTPPMPQKRKPGNANNPGFKKWLAEKHEQQLNLQDIILVALDEIQEPVSTLEVQHYLKAEGDMDIIDYRVKYALDQLVTAKKVAVHLETKEERLLRANGVKTTPKPAYLFNIGETPKVRSIAVAVEGYRIYPTSPVSAKRPKQKTEPATPMPQSVSNEALDFLIEKIVAERTSQLQRQLNEANAKLAALKKLVD